MNQGNQNEFLLEENFCLKFELDSLADHLLLNRHERWVHGYMNKYGEELHLKRYEFAQQFAENKKVLDIAGGCGYGTFLLAKKAEHVTSLDLDQNAVRYAEHRYMSKKITRIVGNAENFQFANQFETIVSFETIEHLPNYEAFLMCVHNALVNGGQFIVSTPIVSKTTKENINPFHVIEWSLTDFKNLLAKHFEISDIYMQNIAKKREVVDGFWKKVMFKLKLLSVPKFDSNILPIDQVFNEKEVYSGFQVIVCKKTI